LQLVIGSASALGARIMCGTSDPSGAASSPLMTSFSTRMVMHMDAEEASMALLGVADAAYLGGGGRLLLRLEDREPVEMYGYQVSPEHLERLVRVMRSSYASGVMPPTETVEEEPEIALAVPEADARVEAALADTGAAPSIEATASTDDESSSAAVEPSNAPIQIFCFGAPRVMCRGKQVWPRPAVGGAKPWEFLLFIACHPPEGAPRERITEALWPEASEADDHTHRFRQLRYRLRQAFSAVPGAPGDDGIGLERNGALHLKPDVIYSDAREFLELTRSARIFSGQQSTPRLERARTLYTADLRLGHDTRRYSWVDERDVSGVTFREHFRRHFLQATLMLAQLYTEGDRFDEAIQLYRELAELDPGDES